MRSAHTDTGLRARAGPVFMFRRFGECRNRHQPV